MFFFGVLKSIFGTALAVFSTALFSFLIVIVGIFFSSRWYEDLILTLWTKSLLFLFNIKVEVRGKENAPDKGAIYLFNHSSFLDIPIVLEALKGKSIRFGAKIELFKIPIFGRAMKLMGVLPITRDQRDKVMELYARSSKNLNSGINYALAPEGTRTNGQTLGDFKSGPFIFAISGGHPLVPVVVSGANKLMSRKSLLPLFGVWQGHVIINILPPVETQGKSIEDRVALKKMVRNQMEVEFTRHLKIIEQKRQKS